MNVLAFFAGINSPFVFAPGLPADLPPPFEQDTTTDADNNIRNILFILYYEILDNIVNADVGVGATTLNGHVTTLALSKTDIDKTVPVIYATAGAKLPFTGLSAKGEVLYSNLNDAKITDAQAELQYNFIDNLLVDVGLKAGYRILDIKLDDYEKNDLKFNYKGPYIGLDIHF